VGQAFTGGQVYVALSRLRSISGLILRSRIHSGVISADNQIVSFSKNNNKPAELPEVMRQKQSEFISFLIDKTFDFSGLVKEMGYITKSKKETISLKEVSMQPVLEQISISLEGERENTEKFRWQLQNLLRADDQEKLLERIKKGSDYYKKILEENVKKLLTHTAEMKQHKRVKTYLNGLEELDQLFSKTLEEVDKSQLLIEGILKGNQSFDFSILAKVRLAERGRLLDEIKAQFPDSKKGSGKKKGGRKKDGPSTYDITLQMWKEGKDIETIAKERELVPGTIEGHLAKAVQSGQIEIFDFIKEEDVKLISKTIEELPKEFTSKDLFGKLDGKYSYAKLRAVMSYVELK
jgi:hypothetical protein